MEAAQRLQPELAIADIGMPQLNGYEVALTIQAEEWGRSIRLIAVSACRSRRRCRASKGYRVVTPPRVVSNRSSGEAAGTSRERVLRRIRGWDDFASIAGFPSYASRRKNRELIVAGSVYLLDVSLLEARARCICQRSSHGWPTCSSPPWGGKMVDLARRLGTRAGEGMTLSAVDAEYQGKENSCGALRAL